LVNTVVAPPAFARTAAKELADLADDLAALCGAVAKRLRDDWDHDQARSWLSRSRELAASARAARKIAEQAEESLKYHPRKSVHLDDVHRVDEAAIALDHVATQLNSLMRGLSDLTADFAAIPATHRSIPPELAQLLDKASPRVYEELSRLIKSSKPHAREAAQAMHPDDDAPTMLWSIHGALLDDSRRMLRELDPDDGPHREGIPAELRAYSAHPSRQPV